MLLSDILDLRLFVCHDSVATSCFCACSNTFDYLYFLWLLLLCPVFASLSLRLKSSESDFSAIQAHDHRLSGTSYNTEYGLLFLPEHPQLLIWWWFFCIIFMLQVYRQHHPYYYSTSQRSSTGFSRPGDWEAIDVHHHVPKTKNKVHYRAVRNCSKLIVAIMRCLW